MSSLTAASVAAFPIADSSSPNMTALTAALIGGTHPGSVASAPSNSTDYIQRMPQEIVDNILDNVLPHRYSALWTSKHQLPQDPKSNTARAVICTSIYISSSALKKIYSSASTFVYTYLGEQMRPLKAPRHDVLSMIQNIELIIPSGPNVRDRLQLAGFPSEAGIAYADLIKWFSGTAIARNTCRVQFQYRYGSLGLHSPGRILEALQGLGGFREIVVELKNRMGHGPERLENSPFWGAERLVERTQRYIEGIQELLSPTLGRCTVVHKDDKEIWNRAFDLRFHPSEPSTFEVEPVRNFRFRDRRQ